VPGDGGTASFDAVPVRSDLVLSDLMPIGPTPVVARWTGRPEGDMRVLLDPGRDADPMGDALLVPRQVHGADVLVAGAGPPPPALPWPPTRGRPPPGDARGRGVPPGPGPGGVAPQGDAVVAVAAGSPCVLVADCGAVALASPQGIRAAVHVGWKGLVAGIIQRAVAVMVALGAEPVYAGIGPCIHPCCYEFGADGVEMVAARFGHAVRGRTAWGTGALDLPAGIRKALADSGVRIVVDPDVCTGCAPGWYSHRRRADLARQALVVERLR
jgi:copper oxidase (laccase) domain-containing protein